MLNNGNRWFKKKFTEFGVGVAFIKLFWRGGLCRVSYNFKFFCIFGNDLRYLMWEEYLNKDIDFIWVF